MVSMEDKIFSAICLQYRMAKPRRFVMVERWISVNPRSKWTLKEQVCQVLGKQCLRQRQDQPSWARGWRGKFWWAFLPALSAWCRHYPLPVTKIEYSSLLKNFLAPCWMLLFQLHGILGIFAFDFSLSVTVTKKVYKRERPNAITV